MRGSRSIELARLKEEERKRRKKTFGPFCEFLVWYLRDVFSHHCECCWSLKHLKMNGMLL